LARRLKKEPPKNSAAQGKGEKKKRSVFGLVLSRGSRTTRANALALPLVASVALLRLAAIIMPDSPSNDRGPIGLPANRYT
jgi:hypothetical protein